MIELVFTMAIMGIVTVVAIGGAATIESNRAATQASGEISTLVTAEQQLFSDFGTYSSWASDLQTAGVNLQLVPDGTSSNLREVSLSVGSAGTLGLAVRVSASECRVVRVSPLTFGGGQVVVPVAPQVPCQASLAFQTPEVPVTQVSAVRGRA